MSKLNYFLFQNSSRYWAFVKRIFSSLISFSVLWQISLRILMFSESIRSVESCKKNKIVQTIFTPGWV